MHRTAILSLLVFLITVAVFARLTLCQFSWWDDQETIHQNAKLNPPTWSTLGYYWTTAGEHETMGLYVPVTYTVWAALAKIAHRDHADAEGISLNPAIFHGANILLHALTAVIVFRLLLALFHGNLAAFFGSLVFALHPVQVEPVGWISGTKDLLCGLLSFSAILMYVRWLGSDSKSKGRRWNYVAGMGFFSLAMLSKPTAIIVPFLAVVVAIFLLHRKRRPTIVSLLPWFILMIPCAIWTQKVQPPNGAVFVQPWLRPAVAADAITFYLEKLIWPGRLCIEYGHTPKAIQQNHSIRYTWIIPAILAILLWNQWKQHRPLIAGALLFVVPLIPVLGFVPFEFQVHSTTADHYLYMPMLGIAVIATFLIEKHRKVLILVVPVLIALAIRSVLQESTWQDTRVLMTHALAVNPTSVGSMDQLGFINGLDARSQQREGKPAEAVSLFDQSNDWYRRSLALQPGSALSLVNLARNYQAMDRQDLWQAYIRSRSKLPDNPVTVARGLVERGDSAGAILWLDEMIRRNPDDLAAIAARDTIAGHEKTHPAR
jgi:hypothetical protein